MSTNLALTRCESGPPLPGLLARGGTPAALRPEPHLING